MNRRRRLLLQTDAPVFDFRLADLKSRLPHWDYEERRAVQNLAEAVWSELKDSYPCGSGYFSDAPSALDLLDWCGLDLRGHLDSLPTVETPSAARHLADLVDAVFTTTDPFESVSKTTVLDWVKGAAIGERLQAAFFAAESDEAAAHLSNAHELWTVCAAGR